MKKGGLFFSLSVAVGSALPATPAMAQMIHHVRKTDTGCLYYASAVWDKKTEARAVSGLVAKWNGAPCRAGALIDGSGSMTVYDDQVWATVGHKRSPYVQKTIGHLDHGAWDGEIQQISGPANTPSLYSSRFIMRGGCQVRDGAVHSSCQPIVWGGGATSQSASGTTVAARNRAAHAANAAATGTGLPLLRPTVSQEAHNPAGEASDCVRVIYSDDFEVEHVSTTQKAVFRNRCSRPIEVSWCTITSDCRPGYTNLATVPAKKDRGFSYEPSVAGSRVAFSACYNGFVQHQGELSKKLLHACK